MAVSVTSPKYLAEDLPKFELKKTQPKDLHSLPPPKTGPPNKWCSVRYTVGFMLFLGMTCSYMARVNVGVAMTAMVNGSYSTAYDVVNTSAEICPPRWSGNGTKHDREGGGFAWDAHTQEVILGAFYYGMPFFQLPAGLLADRYPRSCIWVIGLGWLVSSISTICFPLAAYSGLNAVIIVRVIAGLAESGCYPSLYSLLSRWAPPADRSTLLAIVYSGSSIGHIVAQPVSGLLAGTDFLGGWPSTFYIFGSLGILWFAGWTLFIYDSPMSHPRISTEERDYIISELGLTKRIHKKYPWKHFVTSLPLFSAAISDFALLWTVNTMTANLPIYLHEALRFDITEAGFISAIPHVFLFVFIIAGGFLAEFLLTNTQFSLTAIRKFMATIGLIPSGMFLVLAGYVGCNAPLALTFLSLGIACVGLGYSGSPPTLMEFAAPYAGMVVAIANSFASLSGFIGPLVVSVYTENQADIRGWRVFFWISFGIATFAWAGFIMFGSSELQPWAKGLDQDDDRVTDCDAKYCIRSTKKMHSVNT